MKTMQVGTCWFQTHAKAEKYYASHDPSLTHSEVCEWICEKVQDEEIAIGSPPRMEGEVGRRVNGEGRWVIICRD